MMRTPAIPKRLVLGFVMAFVLVNPAWALFGDDEARKAILELRQTVEDQRQANAEGVAVLRRSILDINTQAEQDRQALAQLRGQQELLLQENKALAQTVAQMQAQLAALDARIKTLEPVSIAQDGTTFLVLPAEKTAFDRAMALLLASEFESASQAYLQFLKQYPSSAYTASVLYWLGNAQYASKDLKGSLNTHKRLVLEFPKHTRVPEAMLAMGNANEELANPKAARLDWEALIKAHPNTEAASTARERLKQLRPR